MSLSWILPIRPLRSLPEHGRKLPHGHYPLVVSDGADTVSVHTRSQQLAKSVKIARGDGPMLWLHKVLAHGLFSGVISRGVNSNPDPSTDHPRILSCLIVESGI